LWLLIVAVAIAALCYSGVFYETGAQFYEACWQKSHAKGAEPGSPEQAARWASCESTADRALFGAGFIFAGNPTNAVTPQLKAVGAACPNAYNQIPVGGAWILAVEYIQNDGGASFADRFSSAGATVLRVFGSRWPSCATTAAANGFPRLVNRGTDGWVYETPCIPCKAEEAEIARQLKESEEAQRRWAGMTQAEQDEAILDAAFPDQKKPPANEKKAPPCLNGATECKPWERDWKDGPVGRGTVVTKQGAAIPPAK
jgi:hypothetical protein